MNEQLGLLEEAEHSGPGSSASPSGRPLGPRQQLVLRHLQTNGAVHDDEAGALVHSARGKHPSDQRCEWCGQEGKHVLASLRTHGLAVRRRSGEWTPPGKRTPPRPESETAGDLYNTFPEGY